MLELDTAPALLVIDMQNGFCHKEGSFAKLGISTEPSAIIPRINKLRSACHVAKIPVVFLKTAYNADYSDRRGRDRGGRLEELKGLMRGSWDAEILDELMPKDGEIVVEKTRNSGFWRLNSLEATLEKLGVNHLIMTGVGTDVCVESTARDAYQLNYGVTTVSDGTWACNESDHLAALHSLQRFGGTASTAEVIEALQKRQA